MLTHYLLPLTLFLTPLFFLTSMVSTFTTPKLLLLALASLLLILDSANTLIIKRRTLTSTSPLRFGLLAFVLVIILNLASHSEGRLESLVGPAGLYLTLSAWAYFLTLTQGSGLRHRLVQAFLLSSSLLSLHSLLQLTLASHLTFLPLYMQSRAFTPTGAPLTTFVLILAGALVSLNLALHVATKNRLFYTISGMLHGIALIVLGYLLLPGHELAPTTLPLLASWNVALDALKSVRTFFLGVGLPNFPIFYKSVKPLFLSATPFWNTTPTASGSEALQILTTLGVPGILAFLSLPLIAFKHALVRSANRSLVLITAVAGLALLVTPGALPLQLIFFTGLGLLAAHVPREHTLSRPHSLTLGLLLVGFVVIVGYQLYHLAKAETNMRTASVALAKNDGKTVYEQNLAAIRHLPSATNYHLSYSQVNLALAGALSQKDELTEAERSNITQLVSQGVREAKLATSLRPRDAVTWQNLGSIYRNLINVAEGSEGFALSAYSQAVALDPANPALRLELGGLLYQLGQANKNTEEQGLLYSRAQREFQTAIQLKGDYANAYYNLAKLLESAGNYSDAYTSMQKAISLLGPDNPDLARGTAELETLKAKVPKATPAPSAVPSSGDLSTPSPLPSPLPGGPIDLPLDK